MMNYLHVCAFDTYDIMIRYLYNFTNPMIPFLFKANLYFKLNSKLNGPIRKTLKCKEHGIHSA